MGTGIFLGRHRISVTEPELTWVTFSSPNAFTLAVATPGWDGTMYYSTNKRDWTVWDGTAIASNGSNELYLRGSGNTKISGGSTGALVMTGGEISCDGTIENLLDWQTYLEGNHPSMGQSCCSSMFAECTALVSAPKLHSTTAAIACYGGMFSGCTALREAPEIPKCGYSGMFASMFKNCASLTKTPDLSHISASSVQGVFANMFSGCTSLTEVSALPSTNLAPLCYQGMFAGCSSLVNAPALPATKTYQSCYRNMFLNCTSLVKAPALPATTAAQQCYDGMFSGCTALTGVPALPATTVAAKCYQSMFSGCTSVKFSSTSTSEYTQQYKIPPGNYSLSSTAAMWNYLMINGTGGTLNTGGLAANTFYYLHNSNTMIS